jgi:hypothetical protein
MNMKKQSCTLLLLAISFLSFSQSIKVSEAIEKIGDGIHPSFISYIYESKVDDVEKEWKSLMKEYKSEKVSAKNGVFADNIVIPSITDGSMDVYARAEKINELEVKFIVAYNLGGAYISSGLSNKMAYDAAYKMVKDFARKMTKDAIAEKLKSAQKAFDKLKMQQKELEEKNSDLNKDIENYKYKIQKAEEDITTNKNEQEKKKAEIDAQRKVVDEIAIKEKNIN